MFKGKNEKERQKRQWSCWHYRIGKIQLSFIQINQKLSVIFLLFLLSKKVSVPHKIGSTLHVYWITW